MSRSPNWSAEELEQLLQLAGDVPRPVLTQTYNAWARRQGLPARTNRAIFLKARQCRVSLRAVGSWITTGGLAEILGLRSTTVEGWTVRYPDLPRRQYGSGRPVNYINREQLRRWARHHMHLFGGLERSRLVMLFNDEQMVDRILTLHPNRPTGLEATARSVRCLDDGRVWPSIQAAAKAVYVSHAALWHGLREQRPVAGLRFEAVEQQAA